MPLSGSKAGSSRVENTRNSVCGGGLRNRSLVARKGSLGFGHVGGGPGFHKFSEALEAFRELVCAGCEAKAEVRRGVPAIAGGEQDAVFGCGLTKGAAIFSVEEPRESGHPAAGRNPAKRI